MISAASGTITHCASPLQGEINTGYNKGVPGGELPAHINVLFEGHSERSILQMRKTKKCVCVSVCVCIREREGGMRENVDVG